ncbi:MAG TPA: hypothetical protein VFP89_15820 [Propionibacteriaceae bacterium]|nr:hypothetical protein [Propionibacteriaceae bacterium]
MSKKASKRKSGKHAAQRMPEGPAQTSTGEPVGQLLFDMPYSGASPRLIDPDLGLHNLVTRAGHNAGYTIDVTLLDAPDHRLIRSGVLLAHRVLDGRGEWYLGAPSWQPLLPEERIEPMGQGDLPQDYADLVRPFRRRATLGPVAALTCERREFALRDDRGTTMALVRDDKVTVRRGGLTTARFREVMLTPTGPGLSSEQARHLHRQLSSAGGTQVAPFPRLVTRLGAPATGRTDFPVPEPLSQQGHFAQFVSALLSTRLREILQADLAVRADDPAGAGLMRDRAARLLTELGGLSAVLDPEWLEDLIEELGWLVDEAQEETARPSAERGVLKSRLRAERYLTLLERLVTASRSPQVGDSSILPTKQILEALLDATWGRVRKSAGRLGHGSSPDAWDRVAVAMADLTGVCDVAGHVLPAESERLRRRLEPVSELLGDAIDHWRRSERVKAQASSATAEQAFLLGRSFENELVEVRLAREAFLRAWGKAAKKLGG